MESDEKRRDFAAAAGQEEIKLLVHDPSPVVLRSLLKNVNIAEEDVLVIAGRKNITEDILLLIAKDRRWTESYPIRLALACNPRSPLSVSLSVVRFLRIFDLEAITRNRFVPLVFRNKVEAMIIERIPTMPLGNKKTLAKRAAGNLLLKLLQERIPEVVKLCLGNPNLVESHLYKVINRATTPLETILMIADHPIWSNRPSVRFSITRNPLTPLTLSCRFLKAMTLPELRDLFQDPALPAAVKPCVHRELLDRGKNPEKVDEEPVYEIAEQEIAEMDAFVSLPEFQAADEGEDEKEQKNREG